MFGGRSLCYICRSMDSIKKHKFILELTGWAITLVIGVGALLPIYLNDIDFPFYTANIAFILIFITFTRYIFLLPYTWLDHNKYLKMAIIAFSILIVVSLLNWLFIFNRFVDEQGLEELTYHLKFQRQMKLVNYIKTEVLFFGVGSIVSAVALPVRLMISVWKDYNPDR